MKWIRALDLEAWSKSNGAKSALPKLVADLIRASSAQITSCRFPSGDKGQVRGFDGFLEAEGGTFVPTGVSVWEFGAGEKASKPDEDYAKRVKGLDPEQRKNTTFVYVTLQTWDNPRQKLSDWVNEKNKLGDWRDVQYIDGVMLEHWLEMHPAVAARYAKVELGIAPQVGVQAIEDFWIEYSIGFDPALTEEVLLCGRKQQADNLVQSLVGGPAKVTMAADSPDEVIAFAVAAIRKAESATRLFIEARCLVVESIDAARFLQHVDNLIFLPRGQAIKATSFLAQVGATVVALGGDQPNGGAILLDRPSFQEMASALETMNFGQERAQVLARSCGRSVTILRRRIAATDRPLPEWVGDAALLVPAFLAGAWDTRSELDLEILCGLANVQSYFKYEAKIRTFLKKRDPPLDQEGTVWKIRAPVDAFNYLGHLIGHDGLQRLRLAATAIFSKLEEAPDPNAPFLSRSRNKDDHSSWIRDGVATNLLLVATLSEEVQLHGFESSAQAFVDGIVRSLPGLAEDHRVISSLRRQLPILAEAAPGPLLSALERMLEGDGALIRPIFGSETDALFAPGSSHTDLLWALETLSWDPMLLRRTALILAKLAEIDPGGRLSNRPINSLRAILLSWSPNTNALLQTRLGILDAIVRKQPEVGWVLLSKLLPRDHDTSSPSSKPRFREASASERKTLTWGEVWESQRAIVSKALTQAGDSPDRLCTVIEGMSNFEPESRKRALTFIDAFLAKAPEEERRQVWAKLRDEENKHLAFADAEWAMETEDLQAIEELVLRYQPDDLVERLRWLFDDWTPDIPNKRDEGLESSALERQSAVKQLLEHGGIDTLLEMGRKAKLPQFVAQSLVEISTGTCLPAQVIAEIIRRGDRNSYLARVISGASAFKFGTKWAETFDKTAREQNWDASTVGSLLLNWPDTKETWSFVARFGEEVDLLFWRGKGAWHLGGELNDAIYAAERLIAVGRATGAIQATHQRIKELPPRLIFAMLDSAISEVNLDPKRADGMFSYYVKEMFKELNSRNDVEKVEIAQREYAYLPVFSYGDKQLTLHGLMAESPSFYVSVLSDVFRRKNQTGEETDQSGEAQNKARAGYQLLSTFHLLPGLSGDEVEFEPLKAWVFEALRLSQEADRAEIGEQYIGHVLAHSPGDPQDGGWPHRSVRTLIEEVDSDNLETGILIERFNMRGVHTRAVFEGGDQERDLAGRYDRWSQVAARSVRTAALLKKMADGWEREGDEADLRARQDKLREV